MFSKTSSILLVDDDRLVLTTLANGLINAGYHVNTAESVDEAEEFLMQANAPPILVILDVRMPGRSGLELAGWLHANTEIPFILLTAYNSEEIIDMATNYGAFGYLVKPIDPPQLLPTIEAAIAKAKEVNDLRANSQELQIALDRIQTALNNERDINVAVGITMVQKDKNRSDAFELLRKSARSQRTKLTEIAKQIINASELLLTLAKNK